MSFWRNWLSGKKTGYYFYNRRDRVDSCDCYDIMVAVSEKKLPARTEGICALHLPRISLKTKIGAKGRLIIGDPRVTKQELELVSKGQRQLPEVVRNYKEERGSNCPWWTFRFSTGELTYLNWREIAWLKKPRAK